MGLAAIEEAVLALFTRGGYRRAEPGILQPADVFLDVSGEDIRRRMYMTQDADGRDWCLRPEYTIPVCLDHIAAGDSGRAADYAYIGPVFRLRSGESGEFRQAGLESIGRADREAADSEVFALAWQAAEEAGFTDPVVRLGDIAILHAILAALAIPPAAERRFMRAVTRGQGTGAVAALGQVEAGPANNHAGLLAALQGQDPRAARAFVEDVLSIAGITTVGGRTAGDIAHRFLARAAERDQTVSPEASEVLARCLAIEADPDSALEKLREVTSKAGIDVSAELDALETRTGFMAARGLDVGAMSFSVGFARNLDYYTGFIFELRDPRREDGRPVAGGGRYDGLMARLGAGTAVPAVGVSIWLDRLLAAAEARP